MEESVKVKNIVDELLNFFVVRQTTNVSTHISFKENGAYMTLKGDLKTTQTEIEQLGIWLSEARDITLENYYSELLGNPHHELSDYQLIGLMVDDVSLIYEEPFLTIVLFRQK